LIELLTYDHEIAGLNLGCGYCALRSTQPFIPLESVVAYVNGLRR